MKAVGDLSLADTLEKEREISSKPFIKKQVSFKEHHEKQLNPDNAKTIVMA